MSLAAAAVGVLTTADAVAKVAASRAAAAAWRDGRIADVGDTVPPERPARPPRPELKPPRAVPRRSIVRPSPAFTKVASRSSSKRRKKAVTGTSKARDSPRRVASEGEMPPFSIFDSMPVESPAALASSTTVISEPNVW